MLRFRHAALLVAGALLAPALTTAQPPAHTHTHAPARGAGIPAGRYVTTLTRADLARRVPAAEVDSLVGTWALVFDNAGRYTVERNGAQVVQGVAQPQPGRRVYFDAKDTGPDACHMPATYHHAVQGGGLTLRKVNDRCAGRVAVLTAHSLTSGS